MEQSRFLRYLHLQILRGFVKSPQLIFEKFHFIKTTQVRQYCKVQHNIEDLEVF